MRSTRLDASATGDGREAAGVCDPVIVSYLPTKTNFVWAMADISFPKRKKLQEMIF